jgi:hypothetical protein
MRITFDQELLSGNEGNLVRRRLDEGGFKETAPSEFEGIGHGLMHAAKVPCRAGSWICCVTHRELSIPNAALVPPSALFAGNDGDSSCPPLTTLVAGDLLMREAGDAESLCERILREWDWWLNLRASSREMAVAWSTPPETDLLLLFNRLDAGYLPESFDRPLAAGRAVELIGHHPVTPLAAVAAGIASRGTYPGDPASLITRRALTSPRFWSQLTAAA